MNASVSTPIVDGEIFGCSFTDFNPAVRPNAPQVAVSVEENTTATIAVFPQPANDVLNIALETADAQAIRIFDMTGKLVIEATSNSTNTAVIVADLSAGVYVLEVGAARRKIVKK